MRLHQARASCVGGSTRTRLGARVASIASAFMLVVLGFLPPARAVVTDCSTATSGADVTVTLVVGTDDDVDLAVDDDADADDLPGDSDDDDSVDISLNGAPFTECTPVVDIDDVDVVQLLGADDGTESLRVLQPADFGGANTTIDLGNGADDLTLSYDVGSGSAAGDPGVVDTLELGTAATGELVGDVNDDGAADLRIDDAEIIRVGLGDLDDVAQAGCNDVPVCITGDSEAAGTADDIPDAATPFSQNLSVIGGKGDDMFQSGDGNDSYDGGSGVDEVVYNASAAAVTVHLGMGTAVGMGLDTLLSIQDVVGSPSADSLTGSDIDNKIRGISGGDTAYALSGDDIVRGGTGNDLLNGDGGNDILRGGPGDDSLNGGGGVDLCTGGAGTDTTVDCE